MSDAPAPGGPDTAATAPDTADPGVVPRAKLWLEVDGKIALSEWRVALLEAVEETGSLAQAAAHIGVSYRTAAYKLRAIEANLGVRLLAGHSGGAAGGGSRLTPAGRDYVRRWRAFSAGLDAWVPSTSAPPSAPTDRSRPAYVPGCAAPSLRATIPCRTPGVAGHRTPRTGGEPMSPPHTPPGPGRGLLLLAACLLLPLLPVGSAAGVSARAAGV